MTAFTTTDLNKRVGDVLDAASREPVEITRHGSPRYVIIAYERYQRLLSAADARRAYRTQDVPAPLLNALMSANADLLEDDR